MHVVRGLLLVKGRHAERLVCRDIFATRWSISIMSIVPEAATLIAHQVLRHNSGNASQESLVFLNNKKLVTASSKACDSFAKELRKDLQLSVCFFAADKDFTHFPNKITLFIQRSCDLFLR